MTYSDILYCSLLGICNFIILRELRLFGIRQVLMQGFNNPRIRIAVFLGMLFTILGGIAHRTLDFNPDMRSPLNWSLVFIIPLLLALLHKSKLDPGWKALEEGKALWKSMYPNLRYQDGVIYQETSQYTNHPHVNRSKELISQAIKSAPESNVESLHAAANKAIAYQELGLLHRVVNEFKEAEGNYLESIAILDSVGGTTSRNRSVLSAYRDTLFRLGELCHVQNEYQKAREYYEKSLKLDEQLGHDDPRGEQATRELLNRIL